LNKYSNILKDEVEKFGNFISKNKKLVITIFFFVILSYGFSLCNFTIGVDTECSILAQGSNSQDWIGQGRFGIGILKIIFSTNQILPFRNTYLAIVLMIVNAILLCYTLKPKNKKNNTMLSSILAILFITSPIVVHNLYFTTYNFEIQVGILLCILASYISSKYILSGDKNKILFILPTLIMAFSIGIYESFISFYFALICYKIIDHLIELKNENKIMKNSEFIKIGISYIKLMVISVVIYYVINKIFTIFIPKDNYTDAFIDWTKYNFDVVVSNIIEYMKSVLLFNDIVGTNVIFYTCVISVLLVLYYSVFVKSLRISIPLLIISIILSPFILTIALGHGMPFRTQQALILITPLIFAIMYRTINNNYIRNVICLIVILIGFNQSMYTNKLLYSDYVRYQQDLDLTREITNKITDLGYTEPEKYKVICIGKKEADQTPNLIYQEAIGRSLFAWNDGVPNRISAFMIIHGNNYMGFNSDDIKKAKEFSIKMPIWPNRDCIQLIDNIIVVKLSDDSNM